jgi:outer membrane protein assembly factor BamC
VTRPSVSTPARRSALALALGLSALLAGGCASVSDFFAGDKVDYRSSARQTQGLEVPPDLTQLARDGRFQAPGAVVSAAAGAAAAPGSGAAAAAAAPAAQTVAAAAIGGMKIERAGDTRWLSVPLPPERIWNDLRQFWLDAGFTLEVDNAQIGVLETGWAENRAKLPQDLLRRTLGRVLENFYDTGERDRFRMRVERTDTGSEVFLVHRGLVEVYTDRTLKDDLRWQRRPADPQLEAEFLSRLMLHLGRDTQTAGAAPGAQGASGTADAAPPAPRARLLAGQPGAGLELDSGFDLAWRRVGLALDRGGFTVEDRDRSAGLYFVRYADTGADRQERGFLARLFSSDEATPAQRYRIALSGDRDKTVVAVQDAEGAPAPEAVGQRIAGLLVDALK